VSKHCETFDHTADIGLAGRGDTLAELFEAMAEGLARFICPRPPAGDDAERAVSVQAEDVEALLVDFLWEVMSAVQFDRLAVTRVEVGEVSQTAVEATLHGRPLAGTGDEVANEVKAVTHHELKVARGRDGWTGRVLLDL